jgi:DNA polymerase III sliding clamp (beta) subunit (PCNA family)
MIRVEKKALLDAVGNASKSIKHARNNVNECVKIYARDGLMQLVATDLDTVLVLRIPCSTTEGNEMCMCTTRALESAVKAVRGTHVELSIDEGYKIHVSGGNDGANTKANVIGVDPLSHPHRSEGDLADNGAIICSTSVCAESLRVAIGHAKHCIAQHAVQYAMTGLHFAFGEAGITVAATDTRRLGFEAVPAEIDGTGECVVPGFALTALCIDFGSSVKLTLRDSSLTVEGDNGSAQTILVQGRFPRYKDIVPAETMCRVEKRKELLDIAKAMTPFAGQSIGVKSTDCSVAISATEHFISFSATTQDGQSVSTDIESDGEIFAETSICGYYLVEMLSATDADVVEIMNVGSKTPCLFRMGKYREVIMPVYREK